MSGSYRLTRKAEADLDEIRTYLLGECVEASRRVRVAFVEAFSLLAANPRAGHQRRELAPAKYRFWNVYSWMVVYRPGDDSIVVVRVLHAARDVRGLLRENPGG